MNLDIQNRLTSSIFELVWFREGKEKKECPDKNCIFHLKIHQDVISPLAASLEEEENVLPSKLQPLSQFSCIRNWKRVESPLANTPIYSRFPYNHIQAKSFRKINQNNSTAIISPFWTVAAYKFVLTRGPGLWLLVADSRGPRTTWRASFPWAGRESSSRLDSCQLVYFGTNRSLTGNRNETFYDEILRWRSHSETDRFSLTLLIEGLVGNYGFKIMDGETLPWPPCLPCLKRSLVNCGGPHIVQ